MKLNIGTLLLATAAIFLFIRVASRQPWTPWHIAGLAVLAPAFVLFVTARIQLGRSFSVQAKATKLVTGGIYSRIRNPIYVFSGLMILGVIVWAHRPWWLLVFIVLVPAQWMRVRKEEQVLADTFGAAYLEYKRKTWF